MVIAGFDIGGTKIEVALFEYANETFSILARKRIPTQRHRPYDELLCRIKELLLATLQDAQLSLSDLHSIGVGMPGTIHPESGKMLNGNSQVFVGKTIACDLKSALGFSRDITCENDANCFAFAEAKLGAGKDFAKPFAHQTSMGIILGTGCGGGIVTNGQLLRGYHGGAAEIGHTLLHSEGHACYCGQHGCAEQYLSGPAIEAHFATRLYSQIEQRPSAKEIFALYEQGDPIAVAVVKQYLDDLSLFLGNLTNIFAPDYFVLGGGVSLQPLLYEYFTDHSPQNLFIKDFPIRVFQHKLGDSAGVIGAGILSIK